MNFEVSLLTEIDELFIKGTGDVAFSFTESTMDSSVDEWNVVSIVPLALYEKAWQPGRTKHCIRHSPAGEIYCH